MSREENVWEGKLCSMFVIKSNVGVWGREAGEAMIKMRIALFIRGTSPFLPLFSSYFGRAGVVSGRRISLVARGLSLSSDYAARKMQRVSRVR